MVEECIRMLMERGIGPGIAGEEVAAVEADFAGAEEERVRAAPRWVKLQIDWGAEFLRV